MRAPLLALAVFVAVAAGSRAEAPKDKTPGPSDELVGAACTKGLLVRPDGADKPDGDGGAAFQDAAEKDFPDLFGGGDESAPDDGKGGKKKKSAPAKKPSPRRSKTQLLRPRGKDAKDCPAKVRAFYGRYGDSVSAVPAPDLDAAQVEAKIDRVFDLAAGPAKAAKLSALKSGDVTQSRAVVDKMFDGVKTLDDKSFDRVNANLQTMASAKSTDLLKRADLGENPDAQTTPEAGTPAADAKSPPDAAPAPDPKAPSAAVSDAQRRRWSPDRAVPSFAMPPVGSYEPRGETRPAARSFYNRWVPAPIQDVVTSGGGWVADKVWGGGDPAVNVRMPVDAAEPPRWRSVRFGNYGTEAMIHGLVAVGEDMGKLHSPTLLLGDISQKGGGTFRSHLSHKIGKDVDVFFITDSRGRFDVPWNLMLAATAVKDMNVTRIFVDTPLKNMMTQYLNESPQLPPEQRALMAKALSKMSYWPGHDTHFHIRIDY